MIQLHLKDDESLDKAINSFKKLVVKEGVLLEVKKRKYFQKPSLLKHERNKTLQRKKLLKSKKKVSSKE